MPDSAVDTDEVVALAIDDRVERYRCLAGLAVANDQLALAATDRNHAVDGLQTRCHRFAHRLTVNNSRCEPLHGNEPVGRDRASIVNGLT